MMLTTAFPILICWGKEHIQLYNDAFRPINGETKHPKALGGSARDTYAEIWDTIGPMFANVMNGQTISSQDFMVPLHRNGFMENCYFDFSYNPIRDEEGVVQGVRVICMETTQKVVAINSAKQSSYDLTGLNQQLAKTNAELSQRNEQLSAANMELTRTQRKLEQTVAELTESKYRFHNLISEATAGFILLIGREMKVEIVNAAYGLLIDRKVEELLGKPLFEIVPEAEEHFRPIIESVLFEGKPLYLYEYPYFAFKDERKISGYLNLVYQPYKEADDKVTGVMILCQDVTEQVLAKKQLEQINQKLSIANENFRNIILQAPVAMGLFLDENMVIEVINDSFLRLWDRDRSVVGKPVLEALPELKDQPYPQIMLNVFKTGETYYAKQAKVFLNRNGRLEEGYYDFINQAFRNTDGRIIGVVVIAHEVTEQVLASSELETALNQSRLSKEAAELGLFDMDLRKGTMIWDPRCRELFGISHDDVVTYEDDFVKGLHPDDRDRITQIIDNCFIKSVSGGVYDVEYRTIGQEDGRERWVRAKGQVYFDENDKPVRFIGSVLEITEQKNDELRKNDFIAMVSHELKTPLTTLSAVIQLLAGKVTEPFVANGLKTANKQIKKMTRLISGFLNISRLESGKITLEIEEFDISELVQIIVEEQRTAVRSHDIIFNYDEPLTIKGDKDKIGSVISNFLSNAVKYSPARSVVSVSCLRIGDLVKVSVTDQGNGIKPEDQDRLFERFYRVEDKNYAHVAGFGIGLYLSSEIIQRHKGNIGVESEMDKGSTFYFTLPILTR